MTSTATGAREVTAAAAPTGTRQRLYQVLIGLTALSVLLQGLWAGIFIRAGGGHDYDDDWSQVHARGAEVAIMLAALATVAAFVQLRQRRGLWLGTAALTLLLVLETYLGGVVKESNTSLSIVHVPLAMVLTALVVYLPLRARRP